jgi:hypothetical protein
MRIAAWNCQMGLDRKSDALLSLNPDVAVVPECSEKSAIALQLRGYNTRWFGSNPHKGLGVISRQDWPGRREPTATSGRYTKPSPLTPNGSTGILSSSQET